MSRRYQQRARSCSALFIAGFLVLIVLIQWLLSLRPAPPPPPTPTPTFTPTFVSRYAIAALPTDTPYLPLATPLPTFTPTPTSTPTPLPTATPTPTPIPTYAAAVGPVLTNLRTGPATLFPTVTVLGPGETVVLQGKTADGAWVAVQTQGGLSGWMAAPLLADTEFVAHLAVLTPPPLPTPTPTPTATPTATPRPTIAAPAAGAAAAALPPSATDRRVPPLVLANYFVWYDRSSWEACNISAGDRPLQPYSSDDPQTLARHVQMALDAGIDGFTVQWIAPGERTDRNFAMLLTQSQGTDFRSTIVFQRHFWPGTGPTQANTVEAIRYVLRQYGHHPNFLRLEGRPVIFFTDVGRVPRSGGSAPEAWAAIRDQVDPDRSSWWIAEGLDAGFLTVFDGLWVYNVTHATSPDDYVKATRWATAVRAWEGRTGRPKLWVATLMPGSDDSRASCRQDARLPAPPRVRAREEGRFYRATLAAALASQPDWLWINSFNEWIEGTYIEPSRLYGDFYLHLTRELVASFKNR
jgi:hypothetical protein